MEPDPEKRSDCNQLVQNLGVSNLNFNQAPTQVQANPFKQTTTVVHSSNMVQPKVTYTQAYPG